MEADFTTGPVKEVRSLQFTLNLTAGWPEGKTREDVVENVARAVHGALAGIGGVTVGDARSLPGKRPGAGKEKAPELPPTPTPEQTEEFEGAAP